jgi:hypothetical protein
MTAVIPLGRFDKIRLREAWPTEDGHFTPWLAQPENLKLLGEALGFPELQDQQTEVRVGDFLIDVLAVDGDGETVIIENQLEQTDHKHLGQLMTYLAGQQGKGSIVWIAEDFRPEHRAAIDWLNRNTVEDFSFFGVELELWRIDNSPPAPRFKLVAQPNEWTTNLRQATRETTDPELAERHRIRLAYWQSFGDFLRRQGSPFAIRRPVKNRLCRFPMGVPGYRIIAAISIQNQLATVGLSISRDPERLKYQAFLAQKVAIEAEFGEPLAWDEKPGTKRSLISVTRSSVNPADDAQYQDTHAWMLERMGRFRSMFSVRILAMPIGKSGSGSDEDDE